MYLQGTAQWKTADFQLTWGLQNYAFLYTARFQTPLSEIDFANNYSVFLYIRPIERSIVSDIFPKFVTVSLKKESNFRFVHGYYFIIVFTCSQTV
jgi:hypothetical protein